MNKFDILGTMRAIRNDEALSTTQAHLLMCAVLRADNSSCKVKYSIEGLAKDANVSERTARYAFQAPEVLKYMAKVEGKTRAKNMWFRPIPATDDSIPATDDTIPATVAPHLPITSTSSSTSTTDASAPVEDEGLEVRKEGVVITHPCLIEGTELAPLEGLTFFLTDKATATAASLINEGRHAAATSVYSNEDQLRERRRRLGLVS